MAFVTSGLQLDTLRAEGAGKSKQSLEHGSRVFAVLPQHRVPLLGGAPAYLEEGEIGAMPRGKQDRPVGAVPNLEPPIDIVPCSVWMSMNAYAQRQSSNHDGVKLSQPATW